MINLMSIQSENDFTMNPFFFTIMLFILVVPGFFFAAFILVKVITLFMISNAEAKVFGIIGSIIGFLFVMVMSYAAFNV